MANTDLNIILKLTDQMSGGIARAASSLNEFQKSFSRAGAQVQKFGRDMAFVGGGMIAPFVGSLALAEKSSFAVGNAVGRTKQQLESFNITLAESAVPTVQKFNAVLGISVKAYQDLDPELRKSISSWTLTTGAILASAGAVTIFAGAIIKLTPALVVATGALLAYQAAQTKTGTAFANGGFFGIGASLGSNPKQAVADLNSYVEKLKAMVSSFKEGGSIAESFKKTMDEIANVLNGKIPQATDRATMAMQGFQKVALQVSQQIADIMEHHLGDALFNALTNKAQKLRDVFVAMGNDILRALSHAVVRYALQQTVGAAIPALSFHSGGEIMKAHSGLAPDEVPIIAQTGEGVLSRRGMQALGGSDNLRRLNKGQGIGGGGTVNFQPVMVIQAWDSQDIYRNRKMIAGIISQEVETNGNLREKLKKNL